MQPLSASGGFIVLHYVGTGMTMSIQSDRNDLSESGTRAALSLVRGYRAFKGNVPPSNMRPVDRKQLSS